MEKVYEYYKIVASEVSRVCGDTVAQNIGY